MVWITIIIFNFKNLENIQFDFFSIVELNISTCNIFLTFVYLQSQKTIFYTLWKFHVIFLGSYFIIHNAANCGNKALCNFLPTMPMRQANNKNFQFHYFFSSELATRNFKRSWECLQNVFHFRSKKRFANRYLNMLKIFKSF